MGLPRLNVSRSFTLQDHDATREAWPPHDSSKAPSELSLFCSTGVMLEGVRSRGRFLVVEVEVEVEVELGEVEWALRG